MLRFLYLAAALIVVELCFARTWIWQGALTPTSIDFKLKTDEPEFRLIAISQTTHKMTIARYVKDSMYKLSPVQRNSGWNATTTRLLYLVLDKLEPNTSYTWSGTGNLEGKFTTPPPSGTAFNFTFAFASCADNDSSHAIFSFIPQNQNPLFFIHIGDLHYGNLEVNDQLAFASMYDRTLLGKQSLLYRSLPTMYMWDDHDFGPNNADKSSPSRPAALATYRRFAPHYPLAPDADEAIFQSFFIGRVLFIMTDTSSQRVNNMTTLGQVQLEWFHQQLVLLSSSNQYKAGVWVNTFPWIDDFYKWGEFAEERKLIAHWITELGLSNKLIIISGDAHMIAVDDGTNAAGGVKVFHAASLDAKPTTKGGPYSHGVWPGRNQYGTMTVTDRGGDNEICFTFQGWKFIGNGQAKRLVIFDTCDETKSSPPRLFTPSPFLVQQCWKRVKKILELQEYGKQFVLWVDSSRVTLHTFLDPQLLLLSAISGAWAVWMLLK